MNKYKDCPYTCGGIILLLKKREDCRALNMDQTCEKKYSVVFYFLVIYFRSTSLNINKIAGEWHDADITEGEFYCLFTKTLDAELKNALTRINASNLVPFTINQISCNLVGDREERIVKLSTGTLKSRETGEDLPKGVFSNSDEREFMRILLPAFITELGISHKKFTIKLFLLSYYFTTESNQYFPILK